MRLPSAPQEWTRRRLQILLAVVVLTTALMLSGAGWYLTETMLGEDQVAAAPGGAETGTNGETAPDTEEDRLATLPMAPAAPEDAQPGPLTTRTSGRIALPRGTRLGAVGVPTGFPRTPEGALGQLIAIDRAALESVSVDRAQEVIEHWAAPGGPTDETWSGVAAVATVLSAGGFPATGAPEVSLVATPSMGLIKGSVGADFVIPCVDFVLTLTLATESATGSTTRTAAADCQRMVWHTDRWVIGPGPEPAPAPSVWPGTPAAHGAGYQWLEETP